MVSNHGYRLERMEILNWGNFQGLQTIEFASDEIAFGPLVKLMNNAVVAGINGAGKTSVMDAYFLTLMPDQRRLRLGVVADSDKGASKDRGRTIETYVIGKHSSGGGSGNVDISKLASRPKGLSICLLVFRHNGTGKYVSIGRLWWYSNYKIKEDHGYIVATEELSVKDPKKTNLLSVDGRAFESARQFQRGMKAKGARVELPPSGKEYFQAYRGLLGNITESDIILLNKAFYLKSINNIDGFIRENMLVENPKEGIERLLTNIEKARDISHAIEKEEIKLRIASTLVRVLEKIQSHYTEIGRLSIERRLTEALRPFRSLREATEMESSAVATRAEKEKELPTFAKSIDERKRELGKISAVLANSSVHQAITDLKGREQELSKVVQDLKKTKLEAESLAKNVGVSLPQDKSDISRFREVCELKQVDLNREDNTRANESVSLQILAKEKTAYLTELTTQLDHFSKSKTLMQPDIYAIKLKCIESLGLKDTDLMFVAELIEVPRNHEDYRRAIESALRPISRILLVHPNVLDEVSDWLRKNHLAKDIHAKRIAQNDLLQSNLSSPPDNSILHRLVVRPINDNPFFNYMNKWLRERFWHPIVLGDEFKKGHDLGVTVEGLVKSDRSTMSKYRQKMEFYLGWDNREKCKVLFTEIQALKNEIDSITKKIESLSQAGGSNRNLLLAVAQLMTVSLDYMNLDERQLSLKEIRNQIKSFEETNDEYEELKKNEERANEMYREAIGAHANCEADIKRLKINADEAKAKIHTEQVELSQLFNSSIAGVNTSLSNHYAGNENVLTQVERLDAELFSSEVTISAHSQKLDIAKSSVERTSLPNALGEAGKLAKEYKDASQSPNLQYALPVADEIPEYVGQWKKVMIEIEGTGLPTIRKKWNEFFTTKLVESTHAAIDEIYKERAEIGSNIEAINIVLQAVNYETSEDKQRFLQIDKKPTKDEQVRAFLDKVEKVNRTIQSEIRTIPEAERPKVIMESLSDFFELLQDINIREKVTDARNHFTFAAGSFERAVDGNHIQHESFAGAGSDGKSSGQTAQISYALLASSLAYRLKFSDPIHGKNTLRVFAMDEFTGKFDSEKPQDVMKLLEKMGFQAVALTPMSKVETLRDHTNRIVLVYKRNATDSVVKSRTVVTDEDKIKFDQVIAQAKEEQSSFEEEGTEIVRSIFP